MRDQLERTEFCLGMDEESTEHLSVKVKKRTGKGDTVVGVCYRTPDQEERVDDTLCRQM